MLFSVTGLTTHALADTLTASVDRSAVSLNETLNLVVKYEGGRVNSDPDFGNLTQQFDVLSNQKSMQHSVVNSTVTSSTEWRLALAPKNTGKLLIPPFALQGLHSKAITISVSEAATDSISGREEVFLETSIDKKEVYVQEQFILTLTLYYNRNVDSLDAAPPTFDNARVEELPRVDYQKTLGQTPYGVSEFKYAVFPDASGEILIPRQTWTVRTTDQAQINRFGFGGGRFKLHRVKTEELTIPVLAKPDTYPAGSVWLPARNVAIDEQWSRAPTEFKVGEPITRTITVTAEGVSAEQLPPILTMENNQDFKFYPDKPKQDNQLTGQGAIGKRTESVAIVPVRAGQLTLPEIAVTWWNSATKSVEKAILPALNVTIKASATDAIAASPGESSSVLPQFDTSGPNGVAPTDNRSAATSLVWPILCAILLLTNLLFAILWRRRLSPQAQDSAQKDKPDQASLGQIVQSLQQAAKNSDSVAVRQALIDWVGRVKPTAPATLKTLKTLINDSRFNAIVFDLEAQLYGDAKVSVDYTYLLDTLRQYKTDAAKTAATVSLKPLYGA